jgi:hypothetical protein
VHDAGTPCDAGGQGPGELAPAIVLVGCGQSLAGNRRARLLDNVATLRPVASWTTVVMSPAASAGLPPARTNGLRRNFTKNSTTPLCTDATARPKKDELDNAESRIARIEVVSAGQFILHRVLLNNQLPAAAMSKVKLLIRLAD